MPNPNDVGIHAIWDNADFVRGMKAYVAGMKDAGKATTTTTTQAKGMSSAMKATADMMKSVVGPIIGIYGAQMILRGTVEIAKMGAQSLQLKDSFKSLAESLGGDSEAILKSLQDASSGTIADTDLILSANRAMMLGLGADAEKMGKLMEVARFRGRAMGLTTKQAFEDIVTGVGRASPMILDNLGIVLDAETTYKEYAKSLGKTADQLTATEKKQALLNRVLDEGGKQIAAAGGIADNAADKFQKLDTKIANLKTRLGELVVALDLAGRPIDLTIKGIEGWESVAESIKIIDAFVKGQQGAGGGGPNWLGQMVGQLWEIVKILAGGPIWLGIQGALLALQHSQEIIGKGIAEIIKAYAALSSGTGIFEVVTKGINSMLDSVAEAGNELFGGIAKAFNKVISQVSILFEQISVQFTVITESVAALFKQLGDTFQAVADAVTTLFGFVVRTFSSVTRAVSTLFRTVSDCIGTMFKWVRDSINNVYNYLRSLNPLGGVGLQHGGAFTVPAGFPNDTFPIRVSSGETVVVTPPGRNAGGLMEVNVNINGSGNFDAAFKREVITVVRNVVGEAIRA